MGEMYVKVNGKVGVLMSRVYRSSDVEIYVGRFLKKQSAYKGRAILFEVPILVKLVVSEVILCVLNNLIHRNNAFSYKINAVDMSDGRNIAALKAQARTNGLAEILRRNRRGRASADDMLSLLGEEERHHAVCIIAV